MKTKQTLYDESWLSDIQSNAKPDSWACDVIGDINGNGGVYLSTLRDWYLAHPFPSNGKRKHMGNLLQSSTTHDHLGAVNELCWYRFMNDLGLKPQVLPEGRSKSPDFEGTTASGIEFYCEVTTLNISSADAKLWLAAEGAPLNQDLEISRILRKATGEKAEQLQFDCAAKKAMALVIFDYSTFSGLGTARPVALADALLKNPSGLRVMPPYLSALIYVERYVHEGRCRIRSSQSAIYHNPLAVSEMPVDAFDCLRQYQIGSYNSTEPTVTDLVIF